MNFLIQFADLVTSFFFTLSSIFRWTFNTLLTDSIGQVVVSVFSIILFSLFVWWCIKLISYDREDKPYKGW